MRRRVLLLASLFLLAPSVSCESPTAPDGVRISFGDRRLHIQNTGDEPIYTMAMDLERLHSVDWMPCVMEYCGRILPGATRTMTYEDLLSEPGRLVRLYYWKALPTMGPMPVPGPVSSREFRLPWFEFP